MSEKIICSGNSFEKNYLYMAYVYYVYVVIKEQVVYYSNLELFQVIKNYIKHDVELLISMSDMKTSIYMFEGGIDYVAVD